MDGPIGVSVRGAGRERWSVIGYATLAVLVSYWSWRAIRDPSFYDFGLAYQAGQYAWVTGHPEFIGTWTGTPLYAVAMALMSRIGAVVSMGRASHMLTVLNIALVLTGATIVLRRLRGVLSPLWWWITAAALLSFAPIMSAIWFKQIDLIALGLALGGFELVTRGRSHPGGALIGASVAFKPLAIVLPFVLLARRETRRAGALALGYAATLTVAAQAWLATRAHSAGTLNPLLALENFGGRAKYPHCTLDNYAPAALLCKLTHTGNQRSDIWTAVALVVVALFGLWVVRALRGRQLAGWELFAFVCAFSPMVSTIEWSHYQVMLAPLFVLLVVRFTREGASWFEWAGLGLAFVLASLLWMPYGSPLDVVTAGFSSLSTHFTSAWFSPFTQNVADVAQFGQYVLIVTGVLWYVRRRDRRVVPGRRYGSIRMRPRLPLVAPEEELERQQRPQSVAMTR